MAALAELAACFQAAYNEREPAVVAALYARHARWLAAAGVVFAGRSAIEAALAHFMAAVPPDLALHEQARVESGRHAVSRGVYRLTGEREGTVRSIGGAYLNVLRRDGDGWKILCRQMNYDVDMTPEMWVGERRLLEDLPAAGTLLPRLGFGTGDVVADDGSSAWTPDAQVALPGGGWVSGRPSISRLLRDGSGRPPELVMHDLETLPLEGGLAVDVGWYELGPRGPRSRWGTYTLLARWVPRRTWQVHWLVATASPDLDPDTDGRNEDG
jgi:ketosteroid isomerase-like protein